MWLKVIRNKETSLSGVLSVIKGPYSSQVKKEKEKEGGEEKKRTN